MIRKKGKSPSFDAMVKFFMQTYKVPTKKDVDRLAERLDTLETLMRSILGRLDDLAPGKASKNKGPAGRADKTNATVQVFSLLQKADKPMGFSAIRDISGLQDKKLRNILYRLVKTKRITTPRRGVYKAV